MESDVKDFSECSVQKLKKACVAEELIGKTVHIDGFNTVITLEIALCQSLLLECMDGTIRDLAGLRGTYRLIEATPEAVQVIADSLEQIIPVFGAGEIGIIYNKIREGMVVK